MNTMLRMNSDLDFVEGEDPPHAPLKIGNPFYGMVFRDSDPRIIAADFAGAHVRAQPQALWLQCEGEHGGVWWAFEDSAFDGLMPVPLNRDDPIGIDELAKRGWR